MSAQFLRDLETLEAAARRYPVGDDVIAGHAGAPSPPRPSDDPVPAVGWPAWPSPRMTPPPNDLPSPPCHAGPPPGGARSPSLPVPRLSGGAPSPSFRTGAASGGTTSSAVHVIPPPGGVLSRSVPAIAPPGARPLPSFRETQAPGGPSLPSFRTGPPFSGAPSPSFPIPAPPVAVRVAPVRVGSFGPSPAGRGAAAVDATSCRPCPVARPRQPAETPAPCTLSPGLSRHPGIETRRDDSE
jgi:hypothetical protein